MDGVSSAGLSAHELVKTVAFKEEGLSVAIKEEGEPSLGVWFSKCAAMKEAQTNHWALGFSHPRRPRSGRRSGCWT